MRIAIFGQAAFGLDTYNALLEAGEQIVGVSTPRTPEGGRPDPLRAAAEEAGLPWLENARAAPRGGLRGLPRVAAGADRLRLRHRHRAQERARRRHARRDPVPPLAAAEVPRPLGDELARRQRRRGDRTHDLLGGLGHRHGADPAPAHGRDPARRHDGLALLRAALPAGHRGARVRPRGWCERAAHRASSRTTRRPATSRRSTTSTRWSTGRGRLGRCSTTCAAVIPRRARSPRSARRGCGSSTPSLAPAAPSEPIGAVLEPDGMKPAGGAHRRDRRGADRGPRAGGRRQGRGVRGAESGRPPDGGAAGRLTGSDSRYVESAESASGGSFGAQ